MSGENIKQKAFWGVGANGDLPVELRSDNVRLSDWHTQESVSMFEFLPPSELQGMWMCAAKMGGQKGGSFWVPGQIFQI